MKHHAVLKLLFIAISLIIIGLAFIYCDTIGAYSEDGSAALVRASDQPINWDLRMSRCHKSIDSFGLWIWDENNDSKNLLRDKNFREDFFKFCDSPHGFAHPIRTLYFSIASASFSSYSRELKDFLKDAHSRGYLVHFCDGQRDWAIHNEKCFSRIDEFIQFCASSSDPAERFDGVQLDVEPYIEQFWRTDPNAKWQYVEMLKGVKARIDVCGMDLANGHAIPVFYNDYADNYMQAVLDQLDYAALMDYNDSSDVQVIKAMEEIAYANTTRTKIVIGSETMDLVTVGFGGSGETYFEEGSVFMERELNKTLAYFVEHPQPSFAGLAIHYLKDFRKLPADNRRVVVDAGPRPFEREIHRVSGIAVDGQLSDWLAQPTFTVNSAGQVVYKEDDNSWRGSQDLSTQAWVGWSEDGLYFAFKVTDNKIVQEWEGHNIWQGDYVELQLDTQLSADYNDTGLSSDDYQLGVTPGNFSNIAPQAYCFYGLMTPAQMAQIKSAAVRTSTGYTAEMFIPADIVYGLTLREGADIGLNINPSDTDDANHPQKCMMSTSPIRQRTNPTTFGKVVLVR